MCCDRRKILTTTLHKSYNCLSKNTFKKISTEDKCHGRRLKHRTKEKTIASSKN